MRSMCASSESNSTATWVTKPYTMLTEQFTMQIEPCTILTEQFTMSRILSNY